jgi:signal transduction histidine kinase
MAMIKRIQRDKEDMARLLEQLKETNQELAAAQEGLVRSEKLASAGRLAAGVAHEVGNPLQIAMGYVELLRDETDPEQRSEILERAEAELTRIDAILQRLLDFAKPVSENIMETDLNALVRECGQLIEGRKGFRRIKVRLDLDESIPRVRTEPEKIRQILVNLIFNAVDAIGDNPGLILLSTNAFDQRVEIGVQDSGTGVAPELKSRIYDPFFTTKPPGHGTGLGLAVCLGLAESIDGTLEIDSDGANGTAAILSLPLKN